MEKSEKNINDLLNHLNDKLKMLQDISFVLRKTNSEILKTDENVKDLIDKLDKFESRFTYQINDIFSIIENQDKRIKNLERICSLNSFSRN